MRIRSIKERETSDSPRFDSIVRIICVQASDFSYQARFDIKWTRTCRTGLATWLLARARTSLSPRFPRRVSMYLPAISENEAGTLCNEDDSSRPGMIGFIASWRCLKAMLLFDRFFGP